MSWWLKTSDGSQIPVGGAGVLIGRAPDAEVVLTDRRASRRHALVHRSGNGLVVMSLGKGRTQVKGARVVTEQRLEPGDVVDVPGQQLRVGRSNEDVAKEGAEWVLHRIGGGLYGLGRTPFTVGGGDDHLTLNGWPPAAVTLWPTAAGIAIEAGTSLVVDKQPLIEGQVVNGRSSTLIVRDDVRLQLLAGVGSDALASTVAEDEASMAAGARQVRLVFLPRGARLYVISDAAEQAAYLPERRAELVSLLLAPPEPFRPGDVISDEVLIERLWPRQVKMPNDLHVLVHRVRKSLVAAGLDGAGLIVREAHGGGTRFCLLDGASVSVVR
ncbi:MAG: FHA domain-containing protein [Myxococcota bacterium]